MGEAGLYFGRCRAPCGVLPGPYGGSMFIYCGLDTKITYYTAISAPTRVAWREAMEIRVELAKTPQKEGEKQEKSA